MSDIACRKSSAGVQSARLLRLSSVAAAASDIGATVAVGSTSVGVGIWGQSILLFLVLAMKSYQ